MIIIIIGAICGFLFLRGCYRGTKIALGYTAVQAGRTARMLSMRDIFPVSPFNIALVIGLLIIVDWLTT